jgi:outer membrane immunogenic protein
MRFKFAKMLAIAAGVAVTQSAFAADMPVKAPVAVVAATWTGIYVGGHGGYGWGHNDWTDSTPTIPDSIRVRNNVDGWVGGGHIGIQRQWGNLVAGVEGSFSAASIKSDRDPQLFVGFIRTFESKIKIL